GGGGGEGEEGREGGVGIGGTEAAGEVAARPGCPADVAEPARPGGAAADWTSGTHAEKAVAKGEARFDRALGQHAVAFVAENPAGLLSRLQRFKHRGHPP